MEGGDSEFANFTLPTLNAFWRPVVIMCLAISNNLLLVLYDAPKLNFFYELAIFWLDKK